MKKMPQRMLGIICAVFIALLGDGARAAEPDADGPSWMPQPAPGEDALVVRRNAFMNKMAEIANERVTIVKFDDDIETGCPILTSLFFSNAKNIELLTPWFSLSDAARTVVYSEGRGPEGSNAVFVVGNDACRYVLTVKRYDRDGDVEKEVQARDLPKIYRSFEARPVEGRDQKIGFREVRVPLINPLNPLNFTGIAFFAPTTFTVCLANADKDLTLASESNSLTNTYKVEIKNGDAVLRISISREIYTSGLWVNVLGR
jgi:hypothetical protein